MRGAGCADRADWVAMNVLGVISVPTFRDLTSALGLVAIGGTVLTVLAALTARTFGPARALLAALAPWRVPLAWIVALVSMMLSLYLSEEIGVPPCRLCWFQRIAMYSLAVVLLVGMIRKDRNVVWYGAPLAAIGLATSIWHRLIELNPTWESSACVVGVPCTVPPYVGLGFMSPAVQAGIGFAAILALLLLPRAAAIHPEDHTL